MTDLGDDFRDYRRARRRARASWWTCDCTGRKNAPGEYCFNCGRNEDGWTAREVREYELRQHGKE